VHKRRSWVLLIIAVLTLGLGGFLFVGCGGTPANPLDGIAITSNVGSSVNIHIEVDDDGRRTNVDEHRTIVFEVSGAPDTVSRAVSVRSMNGAVATARAVSFSGGRTVVRVDAVGSGRTQIEALASGGRTLVVDVEVDLPAQSLSVRRDVHFGVLRGESINLDTENFNFYATRTQTVSQFGRPTLNEVEYRLADQQRLGTANISNNDIVGTTLNVPVGFIGSEIRLVPRLVAAERDASPITVHVFNELPMDVNPNPLSGSRLEITRRDGLLAPISIPGLTSTLPIRNGHGDNPLLPFGRQGIPVLEMVLNAPQSIEHPVANRATLGLGVHGAGYRVSDGDGAGTRWGFSVNSRNITALHARPNANGTIDLTAHGTGNVNLDITFFPIGADGTRFEFASHRHLHRTVTISVEIRNVFRDGALGFTQGGIVNTLNVFNPPDGQEPVRANFRVGVLSSPSQLSAMTVNNTTNRETNSNIFFYVKEKQGDTYTDVAFNGAQQRILDLFEMEFFEFGFQTRGTSINPTHVLGVDGAVPRGIPYTNMFSIYVKDGMVGSRTIFDLLSSHGNQIVLRAASVSDDRVLAEIPLNFIQAIGKDGVTVQSNLQEVPPSGWVGEDTNTLHPVTTTRAPGSGNLPGNTYFLVRTNESHRIGDFTFLRPDNTPFAQIVSSGVQQPDANNVSRFRLLATGVELPSSFTIRHACGFTRTVGIVPIPEWRGRSTIDITDVSGRVEHSEKIQHAGDDIMLVAFVRVGGSYALNVPLNNLGIPRASFVSLDLVQNVGGNWVAVNNNNFANLGIDGISLVPQALHSNRLHIHAEREGVYDFAVHVRAPHRDVYRWGLANPSVDSFRLGWNKFFVRIVVVDPVTSVDITPNDTQLYSRGSLGFDPAIGLHQNESRLDFEVIVGYASGRTNRDPSLLPSGGTGGNRIGVVDEPVGITLPPLFPNQSRRSTIIDFRYPNMTQTSVEVPFFDREVAGTPQRRVTTHGVHPDFEITRVSGTAVGSPNGIYRYALQAERPHALNMQFSVTQVYETMFNFTLPGFGVVSRIITHEIPFDVGVGERVGENRVGMNTELRVDIVNARTVRQGSIVPHGIGSNDLSITLQVHPVETHRSLATTSSISANFAPVNVYDNRGIGVLGYGLLERRVGCVGRCLSGCRPNVCYWLRGESFRSGNGRWVAIYDGPSNASPEIIRINQLTGEIVARQQNRVPEREIVIVIYALDSVKAVKPNDISCNEAFFPTNYTKVPVRIFDRSTEFNQRAIANEEQFLEAFFEKTTLGLQNGNRSFTTAATRVLRNASGAIIGLGLSARTDLGSGGNQCHFELLADIDLAGFTLPVIRRFGHDASAVFKGSNFSIKNFNMTSESRHQFNVGQDVFTNSGFFGEVGEYGEVSGINFENVTVTRNINPGMEAVRFGVLAGTNRGIIRDVTVDIGTRLSVSMDMYATSANVGVLVGFNAGSGTIEETAAGRVKTSGTLMLAMTIGLDVIPVNFGGIVGLNDGKLIKQAGVAELREGVMTNSEASLVLINGRSVVYSRTGFNGHGQDNYVNLGGIAGSNSGLIDGYSAEAVLHNSAYGNTGGVVGYNHGDLHNGVLVSDKGVVINSFSNGAMYARGAMGGVVGRNLLGLIENCHYELYINERVGAALFNVMFDPIVMQGTPAADFGGSRIYAGMIVGFGNNDFENSAFGPDNLNAMAGWSSPNVPNASPTVVGGVVGVNDSGDVRFSFASSAFTNEIDKLSLLNNELFASLPYRGDIFIHGAPNVIVGGIIGRQDNTRVERRSVILGSHSSITTVFDAAGRGTGAPRIGGVVGFLNRARADFGYCYSNMKVNVWMDTQTSVDSLKMVYSGLFALGRGVSDADDDKTYFRASYTVTDENTVIFQESDKNAGVCSVTTGPSPQAYVSPIHFSVGITGLPDSISLEQFAYVSPAPALVDPLGSMRSVDAEALREEFSNGSWFNAEPNKNIPGLPASLEENTRLFMYYDNPMFPFPLVWDGTNPLNPTPRVIAAPDNIDIELKSQLDYARTFGRRNDQNGFNYVIVDETGKRAALFHTPRGNYVRGAPIANRYYLRDLFDPKIDPGIASRMIRYSINGPAGLVSRELGMRLCNLTGEPLHFFDVFGYGDSFEIIITSTRYIRRNGLFELESESFTFDIIPGITGMQAFSGASGIVGRKSLADYRLSGNGANNNLLDRQASVQKNSPFHLDGRVQGGQGWDVTIYAGELDNGVITHVDAGSGFVPLNMKIDTYTIPGATGDPTLGMITSLSGTPYQSPTRFRFNEAGQMQFALVPHIAAASGHKYVCHKLAFTVPVIVYGGAIELDFAQSSTVDLSTSTTKNGVFTTDITLPHWVDEEDATEEDPVTTHAERLLDLVEFNYRGENGPDPLFNINIARQQIAAKQPVHTIVPIGGENRHLSLYFELRVATPIELDEFGSGRNSVDVSGFKYLRYNFQIVTSVLVDPELYSEIEHGSIQTPRSPLASVDRVLGQIDAREIHTVAHGDEYVQLRDATTQMDIIAQDLQTVEIQHFANTAPVHGSEFFTVDESQNPSNNAFTNDGRSGLLKVYAVPHFANIESFRIFHDEGPANRPNNERPWMQKVGYTTPPQNVFPRQDPEPIYEEWGLTFTQVARRSDNRFGSFPRLVTDEVYQVSTYDDDTGIYGWTGVYYLQSQIMTPRRRIVGNAPCVCPSGVYECGRCEDILPGMHRMPLDNGRAFAIRAEFETNNDRKITRNFNIFTSQAPGLHFNYGLAGERAITRQTEQPIGTTVPFEIIDIPPGRARVLSREVYIGTNPEPVEVANGWRDAPEPDKTSPLVSAGFNATTERYDLRISPNFFDNHRGQNIRVVFHFEREENGRMIPDSSTLTISPVLFRVRGFGINGFTGSSITLSDRVDAVLNVNSALHIHDARNDLPSEIRTEFNNALAEFQYAINYDINERNKVVWMEANSRTRLNTTLDDNGFYVGTVFDNLNFLLGEDSSRNISGLTKYMLNAGRGNLTSGVRVEVHLRYDDRGLPEILSPGIGGTSRPFGDAVRTVGTLFNVSTTLRSSDDRPMAIRTANDLRNMQPGMHYIVMNDIVLEGWTPIPFVAASLDGNGKKISIASFDLQGWQQQRNIGLFSTVGMQLDNNGNATPITRQTYNGREHVKTPADFVLKNINLALHNNSLDLTLNGTTHWLQDNEQNQTPTIRVGLMAGFNAGIITNCAVVSSGQFTELDIPFDPSCEINPLVRIVDYERTIFDKQNNRGGQQFNVRIGVPNFHVRVGGLVGENWTGGVISNSRVMTDINVIPVDAASRGANSLLLAGFVAENRGTIVASFYRDGNISNSVRTTGGLQSNGQPQPAGENLTAGFVGRNHSTGRITTSYAMGVSDEFNTATGFLGTVMHGEISSNGTDNGGVAGFVHNNAGTIEDCNVNVRIRNTGLASGFVMTNSGTIRRVFVNNVREYTLVNNRRVDGVTTYHAFINSTSGQGIEDSVFVSRVGFATSLHIPSVTEPALESRNMSPFIGFSIDAYANTDEVITIWNMRSYGDYSMPELVSANNIATSVRRLQETGGRLTEAVPYCVPGFEVGKKSIILVNGEERVNINPVLIATGEQFNRRVFEDSTLVQRGSTDFQDRVYSGHMRLVSDINLSYGSLSRDLRTFEAIYRGAIFDGNGFNINNISFNATTAVDENGLRSVGLFGKLEYATVKNVTLNFVRHSGLSEFSIDGGVADYVGGLAGVSINSNMSDITLSAGAGITQTTHSRIKGESIVGGLVGMAVVFDYGEPSDAYVSKTRIQNIRSNVPVRAEQRYLEPFMPNYFSFDSASDYLAHNYRNMSVAGGIIGMITGSPQNVDALRSGRDGAVRTDTSVPVPGSEKSHVRNIGNHGDSYMAVHGEIAGGLIGAIDFGIVVERANFISSTTSVSESTPALVGKFYVGGLVGANLGTLRNSEVTLAGGIALQPEVAGRFTWSNHPTAWAIRHYGMTVGGAAGFNGGTIDNVDVRAGLNGSNFTNVLRLGGVVGENLSGTVKNSSFGGPGIGINGGFIVGGIIGLNHRNSETETVVEGNTIREGTVWGVSATNMGNFSDLPTAAVVRGVGPFGGRTVITNIDGVQITDYHFLGEYPAGNVNRALVTGGFIGENRDAEYAGSNLPGSNKTEAGLPGGRTSGTHGPDAGAIINNALAFGTYRKESYVRQPGVGNNEFPGSQTQAEINNVNIVVDALGIRVNNYITGVAGGQTSRGSLGPLDVEVTGDQISMGGAPWGGAANTEGTRLLVYGNTLVLLYYFEGTHVYTATFVLRP